MGGAGHKMVQQQQMQKRQQQTTRPRDIIWEGELQWRENAKADEAKVSLISF